jgi:hypothetical protein
MRRRRGDGGGDVGFAGGGALNEWGVGEVSVNGGSIGSCRKREE